MIKETLFMSISAISNHLLILMGLCWLCAMPLMAQDAEAGYQEALRRIEEARVSGETRLILSELGLTALPPEIGQLKNLRHLYLYGNQLTTLPAEIGQLTNLEGLALNRNQLTSLPPEIGQLINLEWLTLYINQLTSLPSEIGQLSNLQDLVMFDNPLQTLPPEFSHLTQLTSMSISFSYPLTILPPEVQRMPIMQQYMQDYEPMQVRQSIAAIAAGIGSVVVMLLAFRWRQRRAWGEKKKRM
jgi:hypothetical protein